LITVPLLGGQSAVGCLVLLSPQRDATDALLTTFAAQISVASEMARLRDEMARRNKDLQTALGGLRSLQRNRELLLSNVSHDLKNPLTPIKVYLNLFARGSLGAVTERQIHALRVIERNTDRLIRMISDLVLTARLQTGNMTLHQRAFGLKALGEDVIRALGAVAEQAKVTVELQPCSEVFIQGDPERIGETIYTLVENAILSSGENGTVEVAIASKSGFAALSVRDSGPGLPAEDRETLFDALSMGAVAKPLFGGRRLGLPLVAKIAQLHGGRVEAKSKLGEGATFRIYLPLFAAA